MIKRCLLIITLLLTGHSAFATEDVYRDCTNLIYGYAYHRDQFNAEEFSNLFTEDASLTVLSNSWQGRDSIRQRIEQLKNGSSIRHEMSTIYIEVIDARHATGVSYATLYSAPAGEDTVTSPTLIGEYRDEFLLTDEGWKIDKRVLTRKFTVAQ
jgi:uncharacterized protein (TIGR02246 family)